MLMPDLGRKIERRPRKHALGKASGVCNPDLRERSDLT
jgi:hypothetical protein